MLSNAHDPKPDPGGLFTPEPMQRAYVKTEMGNLFRDEYMEQPPWWLLCAGIAGMALVFVVITLPLRSPFRQSLGLYLYVHIAILIMGAIWFFRCFLPPPFQATERMRRSFMKRLQSDKLRHTGLGMATVVGTAIAVDRDTLEISVTAEWLNQPYGKRLQDAQNLWRLWADVYSPYDGFDKATIRLLDQNGHEVGRSKPKEGSLIWVTEK